MLNVNKQCQQWYRTTVGIIHVHIIKPRMETGNETKRNAGHKNVGMFCIMYTSQHYNIQKFGAMY